MKQVNPDAQSRFVVLKNLATKQKFYTMITNGDPTRDSNGAITHEVIAYVATHHEAQTILFGKEFADFVDEERCHEGE